MNLLEVKNLNTGYGDRQVIDNVSLTLDEGETVLVVGSNGSGKSTLLRSIFGLLPVWKTPCSANQDAVVRYLGEDISNSESSELIKKRCCFIPQDNNLFPDLTVKQNLEIAGYSIEGRRRLRDRIDFVLGRFPALVPLLKRYPMKLSGGENRLLTFAMVSLHEPRLLMIDEPFAGLSSANIELVKTGLQTLISGHRSGVLFIEHRIKQAYSLAQKIIGLKLGRIHSIHSVSPDLDLKELNDIFF